MLPRSCGSDIIACIFPVKRRSVLCASRPDIAELGVRFINEDEHLHKCHQQSSESFKDDICLSEPHTPNAS